VLFEKTSNNKKRPLRPQVTTDEDSVAFRERKAAGVSQPFIDLTLV
jgi:hypothetical protein